MEAVFLYTRTRSLPFTGGLYEQPHWFVKALTTYYKEKENFAALKKPKEDIEG